jgi:putative flavoprotein involved in K+ transport
VTDERVVVVGGGQAGLAVSHGLTGAGVDHVVLEKARVGESWRGRWDSFCLVTPNWTVHLPGFPYAGPDPDGFLHRDGIVQYLEDYATSFAAPVRRGVEVTSLEVAPQDGFLLRTSDGDLSAATVVLATGAYQRPHLPRIAGELPDGLLVMEAGDYTSPVALPSGPVLVVGSGQTGCQISEELHEAGRSVFLSCGRAPWLPRRLAGRDMFSWLVEIGFFEVPLSALPSPLARLAANPQMTGHGGGHDLHYRTLQALGVQLLGRLSRVEGRRAIFAADLAESVAVGDQRYQEVRQAMRDRLGGAGLQVPELPEPPPFRSEAPTEVNLQGFAAVVFTSGFRPDYERWVHFPAFDEMGFPVADDGASTVVPGLYFAGVHYLRKRKSSIFLGVGEDAALVAQAIAGRG